jgi:predicted dehydrogenase
MPQHARQSVATISRRTFTVGAATVTAAAAVGPGFFATHGYSEPPAEGPADLLNIAVVGLGGQGVPNLKGVSNQNIVALCDVDDVRAGKAYEQHPGATKFTDFRKMFDALEKQIDAVVIYTNGFAPYDWRFWWEFGTGETGNWGCHVLDIPFWALDLAHPVHVSGSGPEPDPKRTPKSLASRLDFPARTGADGKAWPAVSVHWYQGLPPVLAERGIDSELAKKKNTLFIGTDGMLICGFDAWSLLPAEKFAGYDGPKQTIPKSPGFHREWLDACRGGTPATCNFDSTGPLSESVLLANIAYRVQGEFDWDAAAMESSRDDVNTLLRRQYRRGWEV